MGVKVSATDALSLALDALQKSNIGTQLDKISVPGCLTTQEPLPEVTDERTLREISKVLEGISKTIRRQISHRRSPRKDACAKTSVQHHQTAVPPVDNADAETACLTRTPVTAHNVEAVKSLFTPLDTRLRNEGLFFAESHLIISRALKFSRGGLEAILGTDTALSALEPVLQESRSAGTVYPAAADIINDIVGRPVHRGCVALLRRPPLRDTTSLLAQLASAEPSRPRQLIMILEGVSNPDNLGAIFRSSFALSAQGVVLSPSCTDPLYRKALRASMGATLRLPYATSTRWPSDLQQIQDAGFTIFGFSCAKDSVSLDQMKNVPEKIALLVGAEGPGLTDAAVSHVAIKTRIPMREGVDSLNVAAATAIGLYELSCGLGLYQSSHT